MTGTKISFAAENSPQRANSLGSFNIRAKVVPLKPGRSLMDWIRLGKSSQDLAGTGGIALAFVAGVIRGRKGGNLGEFGLSRYSLPLSFRTNGIARPVYDGETEPTQHGDQCLDMNSRYLSY